MAKSKKNLVIVESPAKAKTLEKFLGEGYKVLACGGHVRDLPASRLGVDVEKNFQPTYITIKGKTKIIKGLKEQADKATTIFLAPDPDREGEAIAWHLKYLLENEAKIKRIEFHEITKEAVQYAVAHPRKIDQPRVDAQQGRRILDRLVGYKLSPLLWQKVRKGLSAGRVQSIAVRIICEREKEIQDFKAQEYWSLTALLNKQGHPFSARLVTKEDLPPKGLVDKAFNDCKDAKFIVKKIVQKEQKRNPSPPFITSTLQQDASRKLGFSARKTMTLAQQLYEGIEIKGEGSVGLITYMRTDSVRIAASALEEVRGYISKTFGADFLPEKARTFKTKKSAQDAHEAIRPTYVAKNPEAVADSLDAEQLKLYTLIWKRFVASQMAHAVLDKTAVDIDSAHHLFKANGSVVKFNGFMELYSEADPPAGEAGDKEETLPVLVEGEEVGLKELLPKQHFTEPLPRYNEASLIKELEAKGIGRPSTYAPIMHTIEDRGYVRREGRVFFPTELGIVTNGLLVKHFPRIMDIQFTAHMEDELDEIVAGKMKYPDVLKEFYDPFAEDLDLAYKNMEKVKKEVMTDEICPTCGKNLVIRSGRFGEFYACSGFPECRFTKALLKSIGIKCPKCGGEIVVRRSRRGKVFYGCGNYPKCTEAYWYKPTGKTCPTCGNMLLVKTLKSGEVTFCGNKDCPTNHEKKE
ncbi:DNA topoisomerase I [candidate division WOR-1 bacterium RIFOXYA12_FULL_43_27]|uniref:DNA topoisomerase 1 n=1 Tax=candidate division WOR-1 bacterium RIFOXYC2_FULL_46_14 TaxID=1802587 RepID=A0A1F4U4J7_UNCSA|nr:MAG: DNA topoisomerase I [candidate division WOR-1 bacterium RIFOXYA12_FULL_43_27]OGC20848.1 MAG: DNA topoisomerase I [candidate division WOR-1 bacterium RIFOXYB2_FULL_46_45]OGC31415.1 MAG: DNA topoisomerase I [candidate division WOR-1 bacterium RIFOXYA2_FULL_46_56]OGC39821.1 MAG: DNA topoisomerase I [candidate division WOR-1 bacterium RIFOXYC2_FULL_46_14]